MSVDEYIREVIQKGDMGSDFLRAKCAPTLKNCKFVEMVEGRDDNLAVLRVPDKHYVVVHSSGGTPDCRDLGTHARTLVQRLYFQALEIGAMPVAFANVIDSSTGDILMLETIAEALVGEAEEYCLTIMNGENAILGERITKEANVSGTMISLIREDELKVGEKPPFVFEEGANRYAVFDPRGKAVFINSDGVGTKTEFYERAQNYEPALQDSLAMKCDDAIKLGATVKVVSDVVEIKGEISFSKLEQSAHALSSKMGMKYILQEEIVGERLRGYTDSAPCYNISGSAVSVIDEEKLKNPIVPKPGDYIVAIRGWPNPRSNGITDKRKMMVEQFGNNWHETEEGRGFLNYLAAPSVVLYPVFKEMVDGDLATGVFHMSGGAYKGKLARPLAKEGLFVKMTPFLPDENDWKFLEFSAAPLETAYSKWPMGNDGFVTTRNPGAVIDIIEKHNLEAKVAGTVERAVNGKTGAEISIPLSNPIYFSGKG